MRTVEQLDGLALVGQVTVGPVTLPVPGLLESRGREARDAAFALVDRDGPVGTRHLGVVTATGALELRFPVLAPEISGAAGAAVPVGDGTFLVHAPLPADAIPALRTARPALVVLGNARALWNDGAAFVDSLRDLRSALGAEPALWAPRVALPHRVPLLAYLGIDLVDSTEGLLSAAEGTYLDPTLGSVPASVARAEGVCGCPGCSDRDHPSLARHAETAYRRSIAETRLAARAGRLRELVESRLTAEPVLAEMLRYADRSLGGLLEERTPVTGAGTIGYVLAEAHRRPEMVRFRTRLLERYRPPASKTVLLLVPCSRTKPYRVSRSHRRFASALEGVRGAERVHVVSVSSPIGLVPRELEDVPPARHYDIPVTGEWSETERSDVLRGLERLVATGAYRSVVVHLDPVEYDFLQDRLPTGLAPRWTLSDDRTTSAEAIAQLHAALVDALAGESAVPGGPLAVVREELRAVAAFQFGPSAADRLFAPPLRLAGRPWFQRLTDGREDLATLREERGLFHLTVAGARRLVADPTLSVSVDPALPLTGDLFVPGVRSADPAIRTGDSVLLLREGALAGVGEAALPGPLMTQLTRGLAVRVRHRAHPATDTTMTEERSPTDEGPVV